MSEPESAAESRDVIDLTVIIRVVGGGIFLRNCLQALQEQIQNRSVEVIVPYDVTVSGVNELIREYPQTNFLEMDEMPLNLSSPGALHHLYDFRTAAGLRIARGRLVALLEDYGIPYPDWCEQVIAAHKLPHAAIGGAVEHANQCALNWAVYLLDFGRYQPPLSEGSTDYLSDVNISYKREALGSIKQIWEEQYNEVQVNWALVQKGMTLWRCPRIIVLQNRGNLTLKRMFLERFYWGRIFGQARANNMASNHRLLLMAVMPLMPFLLVWRVIKKGFTVGRNRTYIMKATPLMFILACIWCVGESTGYLQG